MSISKFLSRFIETQAGEAIFMILSCTSVMACIVWLVFFQGLTDIVGVFGRTLIAVLRHDWTMPEVIVALALLFFVIRKRRMA